MTNTLADEFQLLLVFNGTEFYTDKVCRNCGGEDVYIGELSSNANEITMSDPQCSDCGFVKRLLSRKTP